MHRLRMISVDIDGTLLKNPYWRLHLHPWLDQLARKEQTSVAELWSLMEKESIRRLRQGRKSAAYDWESIAQKALGRTLPPPVPIDRRQILALVFPDAWPFLLWLQSQPLLAVLITNGWSCHQQPYIATLGWDVLFSRIIGAESGWVKPDPRIFAQAPTIDCHIGDKVAQDVLGARRAHITSIHLSRRSGDLGGWEPLSPSVLRPDFTISSLQALPNLLESWSGIHANNSN
ncbi:HAD family hydrolase [Sulfobacillus sp. hq2]|uniref:HAD family hydrolase n=1 Tax=Sulfobacillus thermotolerans TaxID=338644 RepID=A0ABM6RN94_9FIRM|nr:HAD family hydrolase [Sulfobacillus sp. hq2]AUW92818.1 hypothetical protein BXT84_01655 [Sulfobacillus thermotolerans]POB09963.1 hypothetical protein CO251_12150 [Sulfobacillus sp. hq2]